MEMEDPKKAGKLKERALKDSEKLKRNFQKIERRADDLIVREELEMEQNIMRMQIEGILIRIVKLQLATIYQILFYFLYFYIAVLPLLQR